MIELDLHVLTVDEALPRVEEFLYKTFTGGYYEVSIVHGKGTGILRDSVRMYLSKHPLVKSSRRGDDWEGGSGVTIVSFTSK